MDPQEHGRIEELLAGYVLRSLSGKDAVEADRLLSTHVPNCAACRRLLLDLTESAADLAFAVQPIAPPETLLPRLHRELEPRRRRPTGRVAGAAAVAAVVVIAGVALSQGMRARELGRRNALANEVLQYLQRSGTTTDRLVTAEDASAAPMAEVAAPDAGHFFLVGTDVPPPPAGTEYGIWLSDGVEAVYAGELAWGPGTSVRKVPFDRARFDRVLVTLEEVGPAPEAPGPPVWEATA